MGMDQQLLTGVIGAGLVDPEDVRALVVKRAVCNQLLDRAPWQKGGIQLEQRLRPELSRSQRTLYGVRNTRIRNFDETARVTGVIAHETITEIENVHGCAPRTYAALAVSLTRQEPAPSSRSPPDRDDGLERFNASYVRRDGCRLFYSGQPRIALPHHAQPTLTTPFSVSQLLREFRRDQTES